MYTQSRAAGGRLPALSPGYNYSTRDIGVLDRSSTIEAGLAPHGATPTLDSHPRRVSNFETLGEALDYAAKGSRGMNFHDARGTLVRTYPYSELRRDALECAARFVALGLKKGERLALVAETGPEFADCFFGAIYAGLWPVPLPLPTSFGGRETYVDQLVVQLASSDPALFIYPPELAEFAGEAARRRDVASRDWDSLGEITTISAELPPPTATISLICNIRADRPVSPTASR